MPFYKDERGNVDFMTDRLWKHAKCNDPYLIEVIPEPIEEDKHVDVPYTPINSLEANDNKVSKPKRPILRKRN